MSDTRSTGSHDEIFDIPFIAADDPQQRAPIIRRSMANEAPNCSLHSKLTHMEIIRTEVDADDHLAIFKTVEYEWNVFNNAN